MSRDGWARYRERGAWYYEIVERGFKYNLMDIQAALGLHQLTRLEAFNARRARLAARYREAFADLEEIEMPRPVPYPHRHAWHLFVVLVRPERLGMDRDAFAAALKEERIGTGIHFPAVHLFRYYREELGWRRGELPNAESVSDRILSLPLFPAMTEKDQEDGKPHAHRPARKAPEVAYAEEHRLCADHEGGRARYL